MSIDAMKAALEALERGRPQIHGALVQQDQDAAIIDLRAAIEQAKRQEPVAWQWLDTGTFRKSLPSSAEPSAWRPLYTAPPQKQTQEPLGFMNACHVYEMQQGRLPYGYVYPKAGTGAGVAVYATPPQRQPLTEEGIAAAMTGFGVTNVPFVVLCRIARAIEAAHGIGGDK